MKKKKTRRSEAQYPALDPQFNLKTRKDALEIDYLDNLPAEYVDPKTGKKWTNKQLKQYLNDFNNESVLADFKVNEEEGRKRIHKKKEVPHERNVPLKKLLDDLMKKMKEFVTIINQSQVNVTSKIKIKKSTNKFKKQLKTQIQNEFKYIKDYYKKDAEDANNSRNRCIYTKTRAQGKMQSINDINEFKSYQESPEDAIIDAIDNKRNEIGDE